MPVTAIRTPTARARFATSTMRSVGRRVRPAMLVSAAAAQWNVPRRRCRGRNHEVDPRGQQPSAGFWRARACGREAPGAEGGGCCASSRRRRGSCGPEDSTYDQQDIVTGKAQFGLDVYPRRNGLRVD